MNKLPPALPPKNAANGYIPVLPPRTPANGHAAPPPLPAKTKANGYIPGLPPKSAKKAKARPNIQVGAANGKSVNLSIYEKAKESHRFCSDMEAISKHQGTPQYNKELKKVFQKHDPQNKWGWKAYLAKQKAIQFGTEQEKMAHQMEQMREMQMIQMKAQNEMQLLTNMQTFFSAQLENSKQGANAFKEAAKA